jgi:hypothetical protein
MRKSRRYCAMVIALVLGAFGGFDGEEVRGATGERATTDAPSLTGPPPTGAWAGLDPGAMLLGLDDMPHGWAEDGADDAAGPQLCDYSLRDRAEAGAVRDFTSGDHGPSLFQSSFAFASEEEAAAALHGFRERIEGSWASMDSEDGRAYLSVATPLPYPQRGDDCVAYRQVLDVTSDAGGLTQISANGVLTQVGPAVLALSYVEVFTDSPDVEETDRFVRLAVERMRDVLGRTDS